MKALIAIPTLRGINGKLTSVLWELAHRFGRTYDLAVIEGCSDIAMIRSMLLTMSLDCDYDLTLFIDDDMTIGVKGEGYATTDPRSTAIAIHTFTNRARVTEQCRTGLACKGDGTAAVETLTETVDDLGEPFQVRACGAAFLAIPRGIASTIQNALPPLESRAHDIWDRCVPFFHSLIAPPGTDRSGRERNGRWIGEDMSFCHRVKLAGGHIVCDPLITLGHIKPQLVAPPLAAVGLTEYGAMWVQKPPVSPNATDTQPAPPSPISTEPDESD